MEQKRNLCKNQVMNKKKDFPILYIKSNCKTRFWHVWITSSTNYSNVYIHKEYGIIGGKITTPNPKKIEHIGRITSLQKAITEANFMYKRKVESGWTSKPTSKISKQSQTQTKIKTQTQIINKKKFVLPMKAQRLDQYEHKIEFPAFVQKKLDGFRCLANYSNNSVNLYTKTMKTFAHLNHIKKELEVLKKYPDLYLDGELYSHDLDLRQTASIVMKKYPTKEDITKSNQISYYVFDFIPLENPDMTFEERNKFLKKFFKEHKKTFKHIQFVESNEVDNLKELYEFQQKFIDEGFEGIIVRNKKGIYEFNKKSMNVLRTKEFYKGEFEIIGAKAGTGVQEGCIIWKCKCKANTTNAKSFWVIPTGTLQERRNQMKDFNQNPEKYLHKKALIKYIEADKDGCVSRNPIFEKIL